MIATSLWVELHQHIKQNLALLPDKPEETAENTLRALWQKALGNPVSALKAELLPLADLNPSQESVLRTLVAQRLSGVPLAHLTGRQSFMGIELLVGPEALVPRCETELLASAALAKARENGVRATPLRIIDVCTGSGNVALALAEHLRRDHIDAQIFAADLSEGAVELARKNAIHLGLDRIVEFRAGDLLTPFSPSEFAGTADLLTCNPPYINRAKVELMANEIAEHEPRLAFDGGPFGVSILMRLLDEAPRYLRPKGWLIFEVGLGQGPGLIKRLERSDAYGEVQPCCDESGAVRTICAQTN